MIEKLTHIADVLVAGGLGATISIPFHPEINTAPKRTFCVGVSAVGAHYVTPLVIDYFHLSPERVGGIAFLLGLFGFSIVQAVMRGITNADFWSLIKSHFGGGGQ